MPSRFWSSPFPTIFRRNGLATAALARGVALDRPLSLRGFVVVLVLTVVLFGGLMLQSMELRAGLSQFQAQEVRELQLDSEILWRDEVLTSSVRLAAATGDAGWVQRYREHEPLLAKAIEELASLATGEDDAEASATVAGANAKLVEM